MGVLVIVGVNDAVGVNDGDGVSVALGVRDGVIVGVSDISGVGVKRGVLVGGIVGRAVLVGGAVACASCSAASGGIMIIRLMTRTATTAVVIDRIITKRRIYTTLTSSCNLLRLEYGRTVYRCRAYLPSSVTGAFTHRVPYVFA